MPKRKQQPSLQDFCAEEQGQNRPSSGGEGRPGSGGRSSQASRVAFGSGAANAQNRNPPAAPAKKGGASRPPRALLPAAGDANGNKKQLPPVAAAAAAEKTTAEKATAPAKLSSGNDEPSSDDIRQYATAAASSYATASASERYSTSFTALAQLPRNASQSAAYQRFKNFAVQVIQLCIKHNHVLLPNSHVWQFIKNAEFSVDNGNAHIYFIELLRKIGLTGMGELRLDGYEEQSAREEREVDPSLVSCVDVDNLPIKLQEDLTKLILEGLAEFIPASFPETIEDVVKMEMGGLPAMSQIFFWSMVKSATECDVVGGAIGLQSFLRRLYLCVLESGLQEHLVEEGFDLDETTAQHECVTGNVLGWFLHHDNEVNKDVDAFFGKLSAVERLQLMKESVKVFEESSWPPGSLPGTEHRLKTTELFLDVTFGKGNHKNSSPDPPVLNPTKSSECYAHWLYAIQQYKAAVASKIAELVLVETEGGGCALDEDKVNLEGAGSVPLVELILERRPFGDDGPRWYEFHHFERVTVLKLDVSDGKGARFLFVHGAPCNANDTRPGVKYDAAKLDSMGSTAKSMQWLKLVVHALDEPNSDLTTDKSLDRPIRENFVFVVGDLIHNGGRFHLSPKACGAFLKNLMYREGNIFDPAAGSGLLKNGFFDIVSRHDRSNLLRAGGAGGGKISVDRSYQRAFVCFLSRAKLGDENGFERLMRKAVTTVLRQDSRDGSTKAGSAVSKRAKGIEESGIISGEAMALFQRIREELRPNRGNTSGHHSPTPSTIASVDERLRHYAATPGKKFFVQAKGLATPGQEVWGGPRCKGPEKRRKFVVPADGQMLNVEPGKGWTKQDEVRFRLKDFVAGNVYVSVEGRCEKETNGSGNTATAKCARFPHLKLCWTRGIFRWASRQPKWVNDFNVAECWFELDESYVPDDDIDDDSESESESESDEE